MTTEFKLPEMFYFPIVAQHIAFVARGGGTSPVFYMPENYISECSKIEALDWVGEYYKDLRAIYAVESGKFYDASEEIAKEWLRLRGSDFFDNNSFSADADIFPLFVQNHAAKELDDSILQWTEEVKAGNEYRKEIEFQFNTSRGV